MNDKIKDFITIESTPISKALEENYKFQRFAMWCVGVSAILFIIFLLFLIILKC